jgi:transcriptional regulator with XRE-family HTH domain
LLKMSTNAPDRARKPGAPRPKPNLELLRARIEKGLSRGDLADMAGISVKQVGLIERGVAKRPREATLKGLADALGTNVLTVFPERGRL